MRKPILIFLFALLGVFSARAYDFEVDGIYYNFISGTDQVEVTFATLDSDGNPTGADYSGSVVIPATVMYNGDTYRVTSIGTWAFWACTGLTSVTIPESVTSIGVGAFLECTSISAPLYNSKIFAYLPPNHSGEYAIPSGIQSIAGGAFSDCKNSISVTIPNSVISIGESAFSGCSGLTSVMIPESVTSIGNSAFRDCSGLTSVTIPNSVTSIGNRAFWACTGLTSVYYTGNLVQWCGIDFGWWVNNDFSLYINNVKVTDLLIPDGVTTIGNYAFYNYSGLTSVTIPNSVTSIGESAFSGCSGLTSVMIPESVTSIGNSAFRDCSGLTSVTIPNSVTSIGEAAFYNCSGLTSVMIPESVTSIGEAAFYNCSGLTSVTIPESVTSIGDGTFVECGGLTSVEWNAVACQDFYRPPFGKWDVDTGSYININTSLTSITFGSEVERIPAHLCEGCRSLTSVTIQEGVDSIGAYAFYNCSSLTTVTIPESVTYIGEKAFDGTAIGSPLYNTTVFAKLPEDYTGGYTIPNGIQWIMDGAFSGCGGLTWLAKIPESVIAIGAQAFYGCKGLKSITLPSLLDTIGKYAFAFCDSLVSVISLSKNPPYCKNDDRKGAGTFSVYETLYVPRGSKAAYQSAPVWRDFANIKEIETEGTHLVTVQPNDTTMGRVTGGGEYSAGEQIILEATPEEGYHFVKWDDGVRVNPRTLTVVCDTTFTAIFAKNNPDNPDNPTANENSEAGNFRVYVQDRIIYLSETRGLVQVYNMAGQCVYNGHATAIPVPQPGVYILRVDGRSRKVLVK